MYFSNASSHCAWLNGGSAPVIGFHSVMERPDSVSRVAPPTTTIANTSAATHHSQRRKARGTTVPAVSSVKLREDWAVKLVINTGGLAALVAALALGLRWTDKARTRWRPRDA